LSLASADRDIPKHPTTVADLARHIRLSPATVSKALNGRDDVSDRTRHRVLEAARKLQFPLTSYYAGRAVSRALRRVGLVSFRLSAEMAFAQAPYSRVIHAIEAEVRSGGGELVLELAVRDEPNCCRNRNVDGLILLGPSHSPEQFEVLRGLPVVCTPDPVDAPGLDVVCQDNIAGSTAITQHLIQHGHRRITFVSHTHGRLVFAERAAGYLRAVHEAQLEPAWITDPRRRRDSAEELARRIAASDCTAVVAVNDNLGAALVGHLSLLGMQLPRDLSVVGFDRWPQQAVWPAMPLTTVDGNLEDVGRQAVELLRSRRHQARGEPLKVCVAPRIVAGNSVAAPRDRQPALRVGATEGKHHHETR